MTCAPHPAAWSNSKHTRKTTAVCSAELHRCLWGLKCMAESFSRSHLHRGRRERDGGQTAQTCVVGCASDVMVECAACSARSAVALLT